MRDYSDAERRNLETVRQIFEGPPEFDRAEAFREDAVWWNGLPKIPGAEGVTEHRGRDAIRNILEGSSRPDPDGRVDSYDLSTATYHDVVVMADGDYVLRQHTYRAKTHGGRDYENVYAFVFEFDAAGHFYVRARNAAELEVLGLDVTSNLLVLPARW